MEVSVGTATDSSLSPQGQDQELVEDLSIHSLVLTKEKVLSLWNKYQQVPMAFDPAWKDITTFYAYLANPRGVFFEVGDEVGLVFATDVLPGLDGQFGGVMFDRKIRGREGVFREALHTIFHLIRAVRMTCILPEHKDVMIRLVSRLGFMREGIIRKGYINTVTGKLESLMIYGILRSELGG